MKLNTDGVWTVSKTHIKVLYVVETLTKTYKIVPTDLIKSSNASRCNYDVILKDLCKLKFLRYEDDGYKLQFSGYDCLAVYSLRKRGLEIMGGKIGIGKESDIHYAKYKNKEVIMKIHRLGRTSFRAVKKLRTYHEKKKHIPYIYLSKISCDKEVEFLKLFKEFEVPKYVDSSRHIVLMEYFNNHIPLYQAVDLDNDKVYNTMCIFLIELYEFGYVHGDFNEFNVLVNDNSDIKIIDFPQCLPKDHPQAMGYLERDYKCINDFFKKRFRYTNSNLELESIINLSEKR